MTTPQPPVPLVLRHEQLWQRIAAGELTAVEAAETLITEGYTLAPVIAEVVMRMTPLDLKRNSLRGPSLDRALRPPR